MITQETVRRLLISAQGLSQEEREGYEDRVLKASQNRGESFSQIHRDILQRVGGSTKGYQSKMQGKIDTR